MQTPTTPETSDPEEAEEIPFKKVVTSAPLEKRDDDEEEPLGVPRADETPLVKSRTAP